MYLLNLCIYYFCPLNCYSVKTYLLLYPFYDLMIFIYKKERAVLPVVSTTVSITFHEVGGPARLTSGPSAATNIPVVRALLMEIQPTF